MDSSSRSVSPCSSTASMTSTSSSTRRSSTVLALMITGVYVGLVLGVGTVVGTSGGSDMWLALLATVVVALAFQPARERAQRFANRLVYGQRATPYEVLAELSRRMAVALSVDEV